MSEIEKRRARWRLILGENEAFIPPPELEAHEKDVDFLLASIYDPAGAAGARTGAGKGRESFSVLDRLAEVRERFPTDAAALVQRDVLERSELRRLLASPEALASLRPDQATASALLVMRHMIPDRSRESARAYVREVAESVRKRLEPELRRAVSGALGRKEKTASGSHAKIDLRRTVEKNLKNYDVSAGKLIPEKLYYIRRRRAAKDMDIILALDQSASMSDSMLYASIMGAALCDMPALEVRVVAFDHRVADISEACREDPAGALFGLQLGGGTDVGQAVEFCAGLVSRPDRTLLVLLTDLFDSGDGERLESLISNMISSGVRVLVLLAMSDRGTPAHDERAAEVLARAGVICASCPPEGFAGLLENIFKEMRSGRWQT